jgi:hypothetical protein
VELVHLKYVVKCAGGDLLHNRLQTISKLQVGRSDCLFKAYKEETRLFPKVSTSPKLFNIIMTVPVAIVSASQFRIPSNDLQVVVQPSGYSP